MTIAATSLRIAAEERLLEAELATLLGRRQRSGTRSRGAGPLVAAALVLLGVSVAAGTWWFQRAAATAAQDPAPPPRLPKEVRVERTRDLDSLPADAQNVGCCLDGPADFARVQRLQALRRLAVIAYDPGRPLGKVGTLLGVHRDWSKPAPDALAPLAALPRLERLALPAQMAVGAEHLAALRRAPALSDLSLGGAVQIDAALAEALAALPHLRALELRAVALDRAAIARLSAVGLQELRLERCTGLDATSLAALGELRSLEVLVFDGLGAPPFPATPADVAAAAATWRPDGDALAALRALPKLRAVHFQGCVIDDSVLAVLPDRLEDLALYSTSGYSADGLRALARLARLRAFRFRERSGYALVEQHLIPPREAAAALVAMLGAVQLRSFDFVGTATSDLVQALAAQPELTDVACACMFGDGGDELLDLAPLGKAPALQNLRLLNVSRLDDEALRPLAACRTLRRFESYTCGKVTQAGAASLLPGVDVTVVTMDDFMRRK